MKKRFNQFTKIGPGILRLVRRSKEKPKNIEYVTEQWIGSMRQSINEKVLKEIEKMDTEKSESGQAFTNALNECLENSDKNKILHAKEELDKLKIAAQGFSQPERYVYSLTHLLGYRQRVAQERLKAFDEKKELRDLYEYLNIQIKQLLAL